MGESPFSTPDYFTDVQVIKHLVLDKGRHRRPLDDGLSRLLCPLTDELWNLVERCQGSAEDRPDAYQLLREVCDLC